MLVAAAGNTALQSVMPAIGREIGIADFWVAVAYTWSAVLWVLLAPFWARKSDRHGRKALILLGVGGFIVSMTLCGLVLVGGPEGRARRRRDLRPVRHLPARSTARSAARRPAATQAYLASRTRRVGAGRGLVGARLVVRPGDDHRPGDGAVVRPAVRRACRGPCSPLPRSPSSCSPRSCVAARRYEAAARAASGRGAAMSYPSLGSSPYRRQRRRRDLAAAHRGSNGTTRASAAGSSPGWSSGHAQAATPDLPRLLRHRPAAARAAWVGTVDRDRDDGRRGGDLGRAMGADPAARPWPARADPVGLR